MRWWRRRAGALIAALGVAASLVAALGPLAQGADPGAVQRALDAQRAREASLRATVAVEQAALERIHGSVAQLQSRLDGLQADLARRQAALAALSARLRAERAHLNVLQAQLARAERALARNLVAEYESDRPDLVTVVLDSHGFADLLERMSFLRRAGDQDAQMVAADRAARRRLIAEATRLGAMQARQQRLAAGILTQRDRIAGVQLALVRRGAALQSARDRHASALAASAGRRRQLEQQLAQLTSQAASATGSAPAGGGHVLSGGGFTFPLPAGSAAPPSAWSPDQGVDISAPGHTPLYAVGSGTIVLHGIGGFGPSAPVLHLDDGRYVYYGHAGPGNWVPVGTHVSAGQVIGEVGAGIVGISTGPHLEIGFCDGSGTPLGPQTAPTMLALLRAAYG